MKRLFTLFALLIAFQYVKAQEQPDKRQLADKLFDRYEYFKSLGFYLQVAQRNSPGLHVIQRVADCYRLINDYENAEAWYSQVVTYPKANIINTYYYAEALLRNKKFSDAKAQFTAYYRSIKNEQKLQLKLATCDSAAKWVKLPDYFVVKNIEKLNSYYSEWALGYSEKDGLLFTSDRLNTDDIYTRTGNGFYQLYKVDKSNNTTNIPVNTSNSLLAGVSHHTGPMALNRTGDTAYITITTTVPKSQLPTDIKPKATTQKLYTRRLQLMIATLQSGEWNNLKSFVYNDVKHFSIGHAALSNNGNILYFVSDMPGGQGGTDIWYCLKQADGTWGKPINCGTLINTTDDEAFPTIGIDGTLYFSSKGLPGMGGFDIFQAVGEVGNWKAPTNLKYPLNSTSDDFNYISQTATTGYISSNREGGKGGDDIYSFEAKPSAIGTPLPTQAVKSAVPVTPLNVPLKTGSNFVLNNIYYDLDKADIRPDAVIELDRLVVIMKDHPKLRIEVASHTDSRAPAAYNLDLSNRRAASAMAYLLKHGISLDRLSYKGYGDTRLINQCAKGVACTEAEHQLNRRTEIRILSGDTD